MNINYHPLKTLQPLALVNLFISPAHLVNISHMVVERACLSKTLATDVASVWSLSGVCPSVLYQVLIQSETFPTDITYIRFKVYVTAVVPLERAQHFEFLLADRTFQPMAQRLLTKDKRRWATLQQERAAL